MFEKILDILSTLPTPGFFVTAECSRESDIIPVGLVDFIQQKLFLIQQGAKTRKFVFREDNWRLIITFFPTTEVVQEKYALKNKVYKRL